MAASFGNRDSTALGRPVYSSHRVPLSRRCPGGMVDTATQLVEGIHKTRRLCVLLACTSTKVEHLEGWLEASSKSGTPFGSVFCAMSTVGMHSNTFPSLYQRNGKTAGRNCGSKAFGHLRQRGTANTAGYSAIVGTVRGVAGIDKTAQLKIPVQYIL